MITCKEVATLVDTDAVAAEPVWRRLELRAHLLMCRHCRRFARQLRQLRVGVQSMRSRIDQEASSRRLEQKIARALGVSDGDPRP